MRVETTLDERPDVDRGHRRTVLSFKTRSYFVSICRASM
jgi:hypothetical protein